MSGELRPYERVRLLTDRLRAEGAPLSAVGYIIDEYPGGAFEVEFSDPLTGVTLVLSALHPNELEPAPE